MEPTAATSKIRAGGAVLTAPTGWKTHGLPVLEKVVFVVLTVPAVLIVGREHMMVPRTAPILPFRTVATTATARVGCPPRSGAEKEAAKANESAVAEIGESAVAEIDESAVAE